MKDCLYLFTGENTFALNEELVRWKINFLDKHGETNWQMHSGKTIDWKAFLNETRTAPFLSEKRLMVVDGIPANIAKEDLESLAKEIHPSTIVVFTESAPDKRKSVTKFLMKNATVKTFGKQTPRQLVAWLLTLGKEHGASIAPDVAAHLIAVVGTDQWHLKQELQKALSYSTGDSPTKKDIDAICLPSTKHTAWVMSDLIGKGKAEEAAQLARSLYESGEDAYSLWNIYLWIMKNLSTIWMYQREKNASVGSMSKETGIHPKSVQSLLPFARKFTQEEMSALLKDIVDADRALKTGEIKATTTESIELISMLERRIVSLCDS